MLSLGRRSTETWKAFLVVESHTVFRSAGVVTRLWAEESG